MNIAFTAITELIKHARAEALRFVNTELVNLYWNVGAYISLQITNAQWGDKTVRELAQYILQNHPELKGFNRSGLYRMIQFYNTYQSCDWIYPEKPVSNPDNYENSVIVAPLARQLQTIDFHSIQIVAPLARQFEPQNIKDSLLAKISWSHHQIILARCKEMAEKKFYIRLSIKEQYSKRDLDRQIDSGVFERVMLDKKQISPSLKTLHPDIINSVRDPFILEFLNLADKKLLQQKLHELFERIC